MDITAANFPALVIFVQLHITCILADEVDSKHPGRDK